MPIDTSQTAGLVVARDGAHRTVPLEPRGVVLGRAASCDVLLESPHVSRKHARLWQDPFGRWVIEDLGSRNGVLVGGSRVRVQVVRPGDRIEIGPFALSLSEQPGDQIPPDPQAATTTTTIEDDPDSTITPAGRDGTEALSRDHIKRLNEIADRLASLSRAPQVYAAVCDSLADSPETVAMALRLPVRTEAPTAAAQVLVCCPGAGAAEAATSGTGVRLSRRVLDAVRAGRSAVMASNVSFLPSCLELTAAAREVPRAVLCAPIEQVEAALDVIYVEMPPERATPGSVDFIQAVARQVNFARKALLLAERNTEIEVLNRQISLAQRIQSKLIPTPVNLAGLDVAVCYQPALWVGGDYCDLWTLPDGRLAFAVGDVCGKGLSAAMIMANLQAALRSVMSFCLEPADVMAHVDRLLRQNLPDGMFVTLVLGLFAPPSGQLQYVNAGHILPLVVRRGHEALPLGEPRHFPLGAAEPVPFKADTASVAPGTGLVVVTDGVTDAVSPDGKGFGVATLRKVLRASQFSSSEDLVDSVSTALTQFRGDLPQQDDVTVLALLNHGEAGVGGA